MQTKPYNQNVKEAQSGNGCQVTYTTMDIQLACKKMEDPQERRKRLLEIDNELEQMAYAYSCLNKEKLELELQIKAANARQEIQTHQIEELQEENKELIQKLNELKEKNRRSNKVEKQYLAYIKQYLYEPIMKAQLIQARLVVTNGNEKQILPKEYQFLMEDSLSVEKTIQKFIQIINVDEKILFEEQQGQGVEKVKKETNETKVLSFTDRLMEKFRDLED